MGFLLTDQKSGHVQVNFNYLPKEEQLEVEISGSPDSNVYGDIAKAMENEGEFGISAEMTLQLLFDWPCSSLHHEPVPQVANLTLSKKEFPYLLRNYRGDLSLVKDIFQSTYSFHLLWIWMIFEKAIAQEDWGVDREWSAGKMKPNFSEPSNERI